MALCVQYPVTYAPVNLPYSTKNRYIWQHLRTCKAHQHKRIQRAEMLHLPDNTDAARGVQRRVETKAATDSRPLGASVWHQYMHAYRRLYDAGDTPASAVRAPRVQGARFETPCQVKQTEHEWLEYSDRAAGPCFESCPGPCIQRRLRPRQPQSLQKRLDVDAPYQINAIGVTVKCFKVHRRTPTLKNSELATGHRDAERNLCARVVLFSRT